MKLRKVCYGTGGRAGASGGTNDSASAGGGASSSSSADNNGFGADDGNNSNFGNNDSGSASTIENIIDSVVDTVTDFFSPEPDDIVTSETVTDTYTSTASYNYTTGVTTVTVTDHITGATETTVTSEEMLGGYQIDTYSTNPDGSLNTSDHISNAGTSYSYSYDTHYHAETNTAFGYSAEMYADLSELLGYNVDPDIAKGIEVVATIASIAMVGLPAIQAGMTIGAFGGVVGSTTLGVVGYTTALVGAYSVYDEMSNLNDIFGSSSAINTSIAMESSDSNGDMRNSNKNTSLVKMADADMIRTKVLQDMAYRDIATRGVFEKMAGGVVYQGVFAGDMFFDATRGANTNFSVGEPYSMSRFAKQIHSPYIDFEPKNQAGTSSFSVV